MNKAELREHMKKKRRMLTKEEMREKSAAITESLFSIGALDKADVVMVYLSAFKEPDTSGIIKRLSEQGKKIAVPISNTDTCTITPSYIDGMNDLIKGAYGIWEPSQVREVRVEDIDIILVPGLAFDKECRRCGFGKGYYDRLLSQSRAKRIGLCYDFQVMNKIEADEYDMPMDTIVTEGRVINAV